MTELPANAAFHVDRACYQLRSGGVIAYPTEGVWGLGCDPFARGAVQRLLMLKARALRKGLILVGADAGQFLPWLSLLEAQQRERVLASWPGPVTWIVPNRGLAPDWITGDHRGIAIRVSAHPLVRALCARFGQPVVSTSANTSSRPAATTELQVRRYFGTALDYILPGTLGGLGQPTRILDAQTGAEIRSSIRR